MLIFADDVVILSSNEDDLREELKQLDEFRQYSGMAVNLEKTRWMQIGGRSEAVFSYRGQEIKECTTYRSMLFSTLVQSGLLYGAVVVGSDLPKTSWNRIESVQKMFLQAEMGVRQETFTLQNRGAMQ
ncbi:hypothetical protein R1sor_014133 [Riccia sorocarpa]|uniref:Reverse transcriptase domain-containing protein n=1 Tax=Riccia sorocarpa TaxID=122646 RepID=A0ABD3HBF0_9MARC